MLGRLAAMGYGPDRVIPVGFHVDYFNDPWIDPFSDPKYSRREEEYDSIYNKPKKRDSLYFTPMLIVDGQVPMLGNDEAKLRPALDRALAETPKVALDLTSAVAGGKSRTRSIKVTVAARTASLKGRALLIALATVEGPIRTKVDSGENAGVTLVERNVVRAFAFEPWKPAGLAPKTVTFPIRLGSGWEPARCRLVAFVQDVATGQVYQAGSIPFEAPPRPPRR